MKTVKRALCIFIGKGSFKNFSEFFSNYLPWGEIVQALRNWLQKNDFQNTQGKSLSRADLDFGQFTAPKIEISSKKRDPVRFLKKRFFANNSREPGEFHLRG